MYLVAVAEKEITLGSVKRSAPSPTRPVEALEPAHRYVALARGWRVYVVEGEVRAGGGTQAANLLSQGRAAGSGPRTMNSASTEVVIALDI